LNSADIASRNAEEKISLKTIEEVTGEERKTHLKKQIIVLRYLRARKTKRDFGSCFEMDP